MNVEFFVNTVKQTKAEYIKVLSCCGEPENIIMPSAKNGNRLVVFVENPAECKAAIKDSCERLSNNMFQRRVDFDFSKIEEFLNNLEFCQG